jgi:hypothetical protein
MARRLRVLNSTFLPPPFVAAKAEIWLKLFWRSEKAPGTAEYSLLWAGCCLFAQAIKVDWMQTCADYVL